MNIDSLKDKKIHITVGTLVAVVIALCTLFPGLLPQPVFASDLVEALAPIYKEQTVARGDRAESRITQQRILVSLKRSEKYDFMDRMSNAASDNLRLAELNSELTELERVLAVLLATQANGGV